MKLREIAHSRTGDKGNILTISLIVFRAEDYASIERQVTAERVTQLFASLIVQRSSVTVSRVSACSISFSRGLPAKA